MNSPLHCAGEHDGPSDRVVLRVGSSDTTVAVDVFGQRRATGIGVLILDGIGCSGWAFRRIIPRLASSFHVAFMHYRGHGRSPLPPHPWRLGLHDLADDAESVVRQLGMDRVVIVGFSMGFQVALEFYKRHRPRVAGLVSLAGPSGHAMAHFQGTSAFHRLLPFARLATRHAQDLAQSIWRNLLPSQLAQTIGLKTQLNSDRIDLADFTIYLRQMAAMSPEFFFHVLEEASRHCSDDLLPRIRVPTLVIAGALDRFVPLATMRQVAFAIPGAEWWVIHEATHALPAEFPAELSREISDFIARIDRL